MPMVERDAKVKPKGLRITLETTCSRCKGFGSTKEERTCPACGGHGTAKLYSMSMAEFCQHLEVVENPLPDGLFIAGWPKFKVKWCDKIF